VERHSLLLTCFFVNVTGCVLNDLEPVQPLPFGGDRYLPEDYQHGESSCLSNPTSCPSTKKRIPDDRNHHAAITKAVLLFVTTIDT